MVRRCDGSIDCDSVDLSARQLRPLWPQFGSFEVLSLFAGTTVTSFLMFSQTLGQSVRDDVLAFAVFPFVIWAAIRFRLVGASIVCLLVAMIAVWGTAHGNGPFVKHDPVHNAILLQSFLAVLSVTGVMKGGECAPSFSAIQLQTLPALA